MITLLLTLSTQVDPWIVAQTSGLADVPAYSIPWRVFAVIGTIALILTQPLWPLHAQALAAGDVDWVSTVTRRMTMATLAIVGGAGALAALVGPGLVDIWLQAGIPKEPTLWVGLALWWFAQSATGPAFMAQNGAEVLRPQTIGYVVLVLSLPLKWWVSSQYGYVWIPWVGAASIRRDHLAGVRVRIPQHPSSIPSRDRRDPHLRRPMDHPRVLHVGFNTIGSPTNTGAHVGIDVRSMAKRSLVRALHPQWSEPDGRGAQHPSRPAVDGTRRRPRACGYG